MDDSAGVGMSLTFRINAFWCQLDSTLHFDIHAFHISVGDLLLLVLLFVKQFKLNLNDQLKGSKFLFVYVIVKSTKGWLLRLLFYLKIIFHTQYVKMLLSIKSIFHESKTTEALSSGSDGQDRSPHANENGKSKNFSIPFTAWKYVAQQNVKGGNFVLIVPDSPYTVRKKKSQSMFYKSYTCKFARRPCLQSIRHTNTWTVRVLPALYWLRLPWWAQI